MASFNQFIQSFSKDEKKKGKQFEHFIKDFLKDDRHGISKIKKVWSFKDAPINWGADTGTDLIFEDYDQKYWAVQAKKYDPENSVTKEDINSFISDSNRPIIHKRLLIISTNKIANNGLKTINAQEKEVKIFRLQNFEDMGDIFPEKLSDLITLKPYNIPKPKPHQTEAIEDVLREFKVDNKGQLIMACGTGKTFTCFWIHQRLKSKKTLVLLPSLNLMSQMLKEWIFANGSSFRSLCVCSDSSTIEGIQEDEIIIEKTDLPYAVTSDINEIKSFLSRKESTVVFSTYQSSPLIAEAQAKLKSHHFELSIADEAHRCAGKVSSKFATILDDKKIRSNKKLFTTATPRVYSTGIKKTLGFQKVKIIDMDDKFSFGKVFHRFPFSKAIEKGELADYKVIIIGIDKPSIKEMIEKRELVTFSGNNPTDTQSLANQIGFIKALNDYNLKKIITFHGRVKKSKDFSEFISKTFSWIKPKFKPNKTLITSFVEGKMSTSDRLKKVKLLKESKTSEVCILSNARCLGEGVDVPSLDAVSFIDPKTSDIDIVQCVGRAIRKPTKKKRYGYIILPVYITKAESVLDTIESSDFRYIWKILNALKSHDDNLKFELDQIRTNLGKKGIISKPTKIVFDLPAKINKSFQNEINTYLINKITDSWNFYFGLLEKYYKKFNTSLITDGFIYEKYNIGDFIKRQRVKLRKGILSKKRIELLENTFHDWSWDPNEDRWIKSFQILEKYYNQFNTSRVPRGTRYESIRLGGWVTSQRTVFNNKKLPQFKVQKFKETFHDWSWDVNEDVWREKFEVLKQYYKKFNTARIPYKKIYKGINIYGWVTEQLQNRSKGKLSEEKEILLEKTFHNWSWNLNQARWDEKFELLKEYFKEFKTLEISRSKRFDVLRSWITRQRRDFHKGILSEELVRQIEEEFSDWSWNPEEERWDKNFKLLKDFETKFKTLRLRIGKNVRTDYEELLFNWVRSQRNSFKKKILTKEKVTLLEGINGWAWDPSEEAWMEKYELLIEYYNEFQHINITNIEKYKGVGLGSWICKNRALFREKKLSQKRINLLRRTFNDWSWDPIKDKWVEKFCLLKKYYKEFGTTKVPDKSKYQGVFLNQFIYKQRHFYKDKKLSKSKIRLLNKTFHDWKSPI